MPWLNAHITTLAVNKTNRWIDGVIGLYAAASGSICIQWLVVPRMLKANHRTLSKTYQTDHDAVLALTTSHSMVNWANGTTMDPINKLSTKTLGPSAFGILGDFTLSYLLTPCNNV